MPKTNMQTAEMDINKVGDYVKSLVIGPDDLAINIHIVPDYEAGTATVTWEWREAP